MGQDLTYPKRMMKKSTLVDQNKVKIICDRLCDRIEDLLEHFNLEFKMNGKFVSMSCPIHGGDNDGALNLYHIGDSYRGNWKCRTHHCEEVFKGSIIGFIRGVMSHNQFNWCKNGDDVVSFKDALDYATNFLKISLKDIKISNIDKEKSRFVSNSKIFIPISSNDDGISRSIVRKNLNIPSPYFISRGFNKSILEQYDVGECESQTKEMANRAVVPIYDINHKKMIGCTGRSIFEKCTKCKSFHNPNNLCPKDDELWKYSKWRHSSGFKTQESLYNLWFAQPHIKETGTVILVESPGNVWKLEENGIHNSVAIFGSNLTDRQKMILDMSGAMKIIAIMDSDDAGQKARVTIDQKCSRTYNIEHKYLVKNDLADMTNDEIQQLGLV
jgi:5S rRNA maturation endonuclease (ribonuclease M5)